MMSENEKREDLHESEVCPASEEPLAPEPEVPAGQSAADESAEHPVDLSPIFPSETGMEPTAQAAKPATGKRTRLIILAAVAVVGIAATILIPYAAEQAKRNPAHIQSHGFFLLDRSADTEGNLDDELADDETYLFHVFDIIPDKKANATWSAEGASYTLTVNGESVYTPLDAPPTDSASYLREDSDDDFTVYDLSHISRFMAFCGYAAPQLLGENVSAGSETFRAMTVYTVKKDEFAEGTTLNWKIAFGDVYDCELDFLYEDVQTVSMPDDIFFAIEEDPATYQVAACFPFLVCLNSTSVCGMKSCYDSVITDGLSFYLKYGSVSLASLHLDVLEKLMGLAQGFIDQLLAGKYDGKPISISACGISIPDENPNPYADTQADKVKEIYPELPVDDILSVCRTLLQAFPKDGSGSTFYLSLSDGEPLVSANSDIYDLSDEIVSFYLAKMQHSA